MSRFRLKFVCFSFLGLSKVKLSHGAVKNMVILLALQGLPCPNQLLINLLAVHDKISSNSKGIRAAADAADAASVQVLST